MTDKMKSRRWWITVWAMVTANVIMFFTIKTGYDAAWLSGTLAILVAIPTSYVTVNSIKKKAGE